MARVPAPSSVSHVSPFRHPLLGNYFLEKLSRFLKEWSGLQQPRFRGWKAPWVPPATGCAAAAGRQGAPQPGTSPRRSAGREIRAQSLDARSEPKATLSFGLFTVRKRTKAWLVNGGNLGGLGSPDLFSGSGTGRNPAPEHAKPPVTQASPGPRGRAMLRPFTGHTLPGLV